MKKSFQGQLTARGPKGAWTQMTIPFDVQKTFGSKARVPVVGRINGFPFQSSLFPRGDGTHYLNVNREMLEGAHAKAGDTVEVVMELDKGVRQVDVPPDLQAALAKSKTTGAIFDQLTYSRKKEFVVWITAAKQPETRAGRVEKTLALLAAGKRL